MSDSLQLFLVQRASNIPDPVWRTTAKLSNENDARIEFQKVRRLYTSGQFRIVNPAGVTIAHEKALPLFERSDRDEQERDSMCYDPTKFKPLSA